MDYTLTATKTIPPNVLGRPLILTAGLRLSEASKLGFLGFGDTYRATFEGSVAFLPLDRVLVAYEFRQKTDPYGQIPGVIEGEDNWHAFDAALILNKNTTLVAGYGIFGDAGQRQRRRRLVAATQARVLIQLIRGPVQARSAARNGRPLSLAARGLVLFPLTSL